MGVIRWFPYALRLLMERRPKHAASAWPKVRGVLAAAAGGAFVLTLPVWLILAGVI